MNILDATLCALIGKLTTKQYQTPAPIELLVYAHDQPLIEYEAKQSLLMAHLVPLMEASVARGHISRVWVYSIAERLTDRAIPTPKLGHI